VYYIQTNLKIKQNMTYLFLIAQFSHHKK